MLSLNFKIIAITKSSDIIILWNNRKYKLFVIWRNDKLLITNLTKTKHRIISEFGAYQQNIRKYEPHLKIKQNTLSWISNHTLSASGNPFACSNMSTINRYSSLCIFKIAQLLKAEGVCLSSTVLCTDLKDLECEISRSPSFQNGLPELESTGEWGEEKKWVLTVTQLYAWYFYHHITFYAVTSSLRNTLGM